MDGRTDTTEYRDARTHLKRDERARYDWLVIHTGIVYTASLFSVKDVRQCRSPIIDFFAPKYIIDCRKNGGKKILLRIFSPDDVSWR